MEQQKTKPNKVVLGLTAFFNLKYIARLLRLFRLEYKSYGWYITLLGVLSFLGGILEGFGVTAIIPILSFVDKGKAESTDLISQSIENFFVFFHLPYTLKFLLIFILVIFLLKSIIIFITNYISAQITTTYEKNTRGELFALTLKSDWKSLSEQKVGYLNQILNVDVPNSSAMLTYISLFLMTLTNLIIYTFLALNVSALIALLTVLFGMIIFFIFKPLLYKNKVLSQETSQLYKDLAHYVDEVLIGIKAVKSMFLEGAISHWGYKNFARVQKLNMKMIALRNLTNALLQPLGIVLIIGIFAYFYKTAVFSFASFAVIVYAINKVFANVQIAQLQLHKISTFEPYVAAIVEYKSEAVKHKESDVGEDKFSFNNQLDFKNVSFSYRIDQRSVLKAINFSIHKGDMVGIIGPSGAGKTTITDLLMRLFIPNQGEILMDGKAIESVKLSEWRKKIGYVSQDAFLINDTVENNIKFYNDKISRADVVAASQLANIYEFIEELPNNFATVVGERGMVLSGGQRQRIILARVLATHPEILILDEATSALDNESEALIQKAIENFKGMITVIVIAHRLSTIMSADKIISIKAGKIVEQGAPAELLKDERSYLRKVYNLSQE